MTLDDLATYLGDVIDDINAGHFDSTSEVLDQIKDALS